MNRVLSSLKCERLNCHLSLSLRFIRLPGSWGEGSSSCPSPGFPPSSLPLHCVQTHFCPDHQEKETGLGVPLQSCRESCRDEAGFFRCPDLVLAFGAWVSHCPSLRLSFSSVKREAWIRELLDLCHRTHAWCSGSPGANVVPSW